MTKGTRDVRDIADEVRVLAPRVLARLEPELNSGCWLWPGSTGSGYGVIGGKRMRFRLVHRVIFEAEHGAIPGGMIVMHKCDTPLCANPAHLVLGTPSDNVRDMVRKGRARPSRRGRSIDVPVDIQGVIAARHRRYEAQNGTNALAREFGVSPRTVRRIVQRFSTASLTGGEQ